MNKLKEIRTKKGLSNKEASKMLGISEAYLSQLESGYRQISRKMLENICKTFNVKPNEILEYDEFVYIDENNREFNEQDIKLLNLLKALSDSDRDELNTFIEYLIFKHERKIEEMRNGKKGN